MDLSEELAQRMILEAAEQLAVYVEFPLKNGKVDSRSIAASSNATVIGPVTLLTFINSKQQTNLYENLGFILKELRSNLIISDSASIENNYMVKVNSSKERAEVFVICSGKNH